MARFMRRGRGCHSSSRFMRVNKRGRLFYDSVTPNSMDFFQQFSEQGTRIDLAFVDGNHDYEFALFDLQSAAKLIRPGGIIVMDDANQTGSLWASKTFLEQNPGWKELGHRVLTATDSDEPFGPLPTMLPRCNLVLLQALHEIVVGRLPFTKGQVAFDGSQVDGIELQAVAKLKCDPVRGVGGESPHSFGSGRGAGGVARRCDRACIASEPGVSSRGGAAFTSPRRRSTATLPDRAGTTRRWRRRGAAKPVFCCGRVVGSGRVRCTSWAKARPAPLRRCCARERKAGGRRSKPTRPRPSGRST
ncbi:MAG: class I SAM-dependent methyltransferase [Planctomycetaceae bacterium]|nr:class I SAM-dependent methyltransferase [Planctomycetaceae bacterium]